jgi:tRNA-dihydrouridine synthase
MAVSTQTKTVQLETNRASAVPAHPFVRFEEEEVMSVVIVAGRGDACCDTEWQPNAEVANGAVDRPMEPVLSIPTPPSRAPPKIPVDRQWLQKVLRRFWHTSNPSDSQPPDDTVHIPAFCCAPMVDQSDLPFRLQCRRYNVNLCYTPMIHAQLFQKSRRYRETFMIHPDCSNIDRPLVAQICGSSVEAVVKTALELAPFVDAIDINCGCPQFIAKRGHYGAFLLEDEAYLLQLVTELVAVLPIPLTVKVRLLPAAVTDESTATSTTKTAAPSLPQQYDLPRSLRLYERLIDAGVHGLCLHGRTRHQKGPMTGPACWDALQQTVAAFSHRVPVLVNGNVASRDDARRCLHCTGADGVLSAEALLEYPPLLATAERPSRRALAEEYLQLARAYPPDRFGQGSPAIKIVKQHVHRFGHVYLGGDARRQRLLDALTMDAVAAVVQSWPEHDDGHLAWYYRHRGGSAAQELLEDAGDCFAQLFDEEE